MGAPQRSCGRGFAAKKVQRGEPAADPCTVRTLGAWLLLVSGLVVGVLASTRSGSAVVPLGIVTVLCGGALVVAAGLRPLRAGALGLAVVLLGLARGLFSGAPPPDRIEAAGRGQAPRLRDLEVVSASTPGPRCRVWVLPNRGPQLEVALPSTLCPLWAGERVAVLAESLHTDAGRLRPGEVRVLGISRAWRRPAVPPSTVVTTLLRRGSKTLATIRQAGWDAARGRPGRGFVVASSLGLSTALPPPVRAQLRRAGIGHLIAVSGLHVGLAAWVWLRGLRWVLAPRWWGARAAVAASAVPVAAYVVLTGAAAPAVRAATMFGVVALGAVCGRPIHGPTVLTLAVALMLFARPSWLLEPGFQLSVAAMVVLVGMESGAGAARTSWHLGWALLPLLWIHFDAGSDGSVVANVLVMPLFALWVVPWAVAGWVAMPLLGPAALDPAAAGADVILAIANVVSSWPDIPRAAWVAGAVLTWIPQVRRGVSERGRAWLPHRLAALALLLVAASCAYSRVRTAALPGWVAFGGGRHPEVLAVDARGLACVRDPSTAAGPWTGRLALHETVAVVAVQQSPRGSISDPALREWWRGLQRLAPEPARSLPACTLPSRTDVRRALELCAALSPLPTARRRSGGALECWSAAGGVWRAAPLHFEETLP